MFTNNQKVILQILSGQPDRASTLSELGRQMGKAPGVFQRGLNSLEKAGYITSRYETNRRLLAFNRAHPLMEEIIAIVNNGNFALPADVYFGFRSQTGSGAHRVAEPPGLYQSTKRKILILAGPNGAGKTTFAREFLPGEADCPLFINADFIAHALSPFSPDAAALRAGKLMITELNQHMENGRNIALETTLSGRRYARLIPRWQKQGYAVKLVFLSLPSVELAMARVAGRVLQGGHSISEQTIRRRFDAGHKNFESIYKPIVDAWALYDSSGDQPVLLEEEEQ